MDPYYCCLLIEQFFCYRSQHYDNLQHSETPTKQPLKDATNTTSSVKVTNNNESESSETDNSVRGDNQTQESQGAQPGSRSLQCLETLAQKAGITVDDCKYDIANTLLNLDRGHDRQDYQDMSEIKQQQNQQQQQQVR